MSVEKILPKLPLEPGKEHLEHLMEVDDEAFDELYKEYCFYKREQVITNEDAYTEVFGFADKPMQTGYGAKCRCTACDNDFIAGYKNSKKGEEESGIILVQGDDGVYMTAMPVKMTATLLYTEKTIFLNAPCAAKRFL